MPCRAATPNANISEPAIEVPRHLTQRELSRRWRLSERTLEAWRWRQQGPQYLKLGGVVLYRASDVEAFERSQLRTGGSKL